MIVCIPDTVFQGLNLHTHNRPDTPHRVECSCSQKSTLTVADEYDVEVRRYRVCRRPHRHVWVQQWTYRLSLIPHPHHVPSV